MLRWKDFGRYPTDADLIPNYPFGMEEVLSGEGCHGVALPHLKVACVVKESHGRVRNGAACGQERGRLVEDVAGKTLSAV